MRTHNEKTEWLQFAKTSFSTRMLKITDKYVLAFQDLIFINVLKYKVYYISGCFPKRN